MKRVYSLLLALVALYGFAQIPAGYYDSAKGLTGPSLKSELSRIISNGHRDNGYDGLWNGYKTTDIDNFYEKDGTILDMYSENPTGTDPYKYTVGTGQCGTYDIEGDCYNREHIIPQSFFNERFPMKSDIHFIRPTDGKVNGMRGTYPFGIVRTASYTSKNGSKVGSSASSGYSGTVFEPIDAFKGDVARMIFYFVTRYESQLSTFSTGGILGGSAYPGLQKWELDQLMIWSANDPVSPEEIARNNASYTFQGNRNPYIDHPEYVQAVWGTQISDTQAPTAPTNLTSTGATSSTVSLSWTASTDNVGVSSYDIYVDGVLRTSVAGTATTATISGLTANTTYTFYVIAKDGAGNMSTASNSIQANTNDIITPPANVNDIFFSEYVEGSSNNKALEISNNTGATVDLSNYSIKKQINGAGAWTSEYKLSGSLNQEQAIVFTNASASFNCNFKSISVSGAPLDFNGNDPVGLFKNGILIDIIGNLNNSSIFAADKTLLRLVSSPNVNYTPSEWQSYPADYCSSLGIPNGGTLATTDFTKDSKFSVYPNPVRNGEFYVNGLHEASDVQIFSFTGQLVQTFKSVRNAERLQLRKIPKGVYLIKVGNQTSKLIIE